jgi:hypothetical protein
MAPKYHLVVQWVVGEVVSVENALVFHPLPLLALAASSANPPRRGFESQVYNTITHDSIIKCYSSSVTTISASSSIRTTNIVSSSESMNSSMASTIRRTPHVQGRGGWHRRKARRDSETPRKVGGRGDRAS